MKKELQQMLWNIFLRLARSKQKDMAHLARIRAAIFYVKGVKAMRLTFLGYLGLSLLCLLLGSGFILLHIGLFFYLPWTIAAKGLLLLVLGALYLAIGAIALAVLSSEGLWMRLTQADRAVGRAVQNRPLCSRGKEE